jgi:hypothetical protein
MSSTTISRCWWRDAQGSSERNASIVRAMVHNGYMSKLDLAERFRSATNPEEVRRLGDELGRMVFGR